MAIWSDAKWIVVALMGICIVAPMALSFFYIFHGLKPSTVTNVMPHTFEITPEGIKVNMMEAMPPENEPAESSACVDIIRCSRFYAREEFGRMIPGLTSIALPLKNNKEGFLWLHQGAFSSAGDFRDALTLIANGRLDT